MLDTEVLSRTPPRVLDVVTPLGDVRFAVRLGGWDVPARPELTWRLDSGAWLCRWRHPSVRLDVVSGRSVPRLPAGYPAVTREVTIIRVLARETVGEFVVQAELAGAPADGGSTWESAFTAETADAVVSVGGPGAEKLRRCSRAGQHVPPYWSRLLAGDAVERTGGRLTWRLPVVERGDYAELWVSVAWSEPSEHPGTWSAVDIDPARVLRELTQ
ncbi:hypothetical protein [Amycolatopsis australiensis]|uniref:Uncharacterized protein n=1 Tax=Amycolatopsis australiensis TaxID=546364 RepID=A0A1K1QJY0_9PSEU|nr:hypothetical protein [Amycolatopsis australiensis]SFW60240.1 hypothetical protein SAMN04489730_1908 [Amycolatopsis australiensis]